MSKATEKVQKSVREYLLTHHPTEELQASLMGMEGYNFGTSVFLGPIVTAAGQRNYHVGLTNSHLLLLPLSFWNGKPSDDAIEIHLARVKKLEFKKGVLLSHLNIEYGENLTRSLIISLPFKKSGEAFARAFSFISPSTITEEEMTAAVQDEARHSEEKGDRILRMAIAFVLVIILVIVVNLLF